MLKRWLKNWLGITALEAQIRVPAVAQTAGVIAEWTAAREQYPAGSPKHIAFTNRLKSLGVKCGD